MVRARLKKPSFWLTLLGTAILILLLLALVDVFADFRARLAGSHR